MNGATSSLGRDEQVLEFPAPLCEVCNIPKWVNKRFSFTSLPQASRLGYECRLCSAKKRFFAREQQFGMLERKL
jgi:hypothetical protein